MSMSTDLSDWVESLKRYLAMPGTFADTFPDTTDDDLTGSLADGFAECQMDGYFITSSATHLGGSGTAYDLDVDLGTVTPDLVPAQMALIVLYAACTTVRSQLLNLQNKVRYQAGNAQYETEQTAAMLTALFKDLSARKASILQRALSTNSGIAFAMADSYFVKAVGTYPGSLSFYNEDINRADGPYPWFVGG